MGFSTDRPGVGLVIRAEASTALGVFYCTGTVIDRQRLTSEQHSSCVGGVCSLYILYTLTILFILCVGCFFFAVLSILRSSNYTFLFVFAVGSLLAFCYYNIYISFGTHTNICYLLFISLAKCRRFGGCRSWSFVWECTSNFN